MDKIDRKAHYGKKGLYNGYDKNNKERDKLDFYATPSEEVVNILNTLNIDFNYANILEPCCGSGHMIKGITEYLSSSSVENYGFVATDIQERQLITENYNELAHMGKEFDFMSDDYPFTEDVDYIIMNPPYSIIEPFTMKALSIASKGVLMLGRLQFLEGEKRFENLFKYSPPTDVYVYVDRIACYKNGNFNIKADSAQAYAWFYWNLEDTSLNDTKVHWIRRNNKKEI